jgi:hypothetical protein
MEQSGRPVGVFGDHQSEVANLLLHRAIVKVWGAARKVNSPSDQMDEEQGVVCDQPGAGPSFLREKVSCPQ